MKDNAVIKKTGGIVAISMMLGIMGGMAAKHLLQPDYVVDVYDEEGNLQGHEIKRSPVKSWLVSLRENDF
ncbi:MAG: hypothetical protein LUE23_10620 [Lachnospiraceae bacterium]|nr:hypothetical protein [Lachnospiraceae bacterium]MCD8125457.1 hypothetical protein [Lachnospiraceae bacterium]